MSELSTPYGTLTIRPAIQADGSRLRRLRLEALTDSSQAFAADLDRTASEPDEAWVERIEKNAQDDAGTIMLASAGQDLVGMCGLGRGHWPKTRHSAVIWGVYVQPGWRGLGVGEALVQACLA